MYLVFQIQKKNHLFGQLGQLGDGEKTAYIIIGVHMTISVAWETILLFFNSSPLRIILICSGVWISKKFQKYI